MMQLSDEDVQRIAKAVYEYDAAKQIEGTEFLFQILGLLVVIGACLLFGSWLAS
jgi:hypothetical protein